MPPVEIHCHFREMAYSYMKFHILTLFPEMVEQGLNTSIIGRAAAKGLLSINAVNIRDYTHGKTWESR